MSDLGILFSSFMKLFTYEFTLYGFSISFFQMFLFSALISIIGYLLASIFRG